MVFSIYHKIGLSAPMHYFLAYNRQRRNDSFLYRQAWEPPASRLKPRTFGSSSRSRHELVPARERARKPQHKARALECGSLLPPLGCGYLQGASKLAHFHEKVGKVKNSPTWRADLFCANERKAFHCLSSTPPFHLSLSGFSEAAKRSPNWPWDFFAAR